MTKEQMIQALQLLNEKLKQRGLKADLGLYGGAVMCLVFNAREGTKDIDAIFEPKMDVYRIAEEVAQDLGLDPDWLNDGVKGFVSANNELVLYNQMSNLRIFTVTPKYMLAMKVISCRMTGSKDVEDIKFLIRYLGLTSVDEVLSIVYTYYPLNRVPQRAYYVLDEIFGGS